MTMWALLTSITVHGCGLYDIYEYIYILYDVEDF